MKAFIVFSPGALPEPFRLTLFRRDKGLAFDTWKTKGAILGLSGHIWDGHIWDGSKLNTTRGLQVLVHVSILPGFHFGGCSMFDPHLKPSVWRLI